MYTSIQGQADRKTLASTWCGHCRERVTSHISDFQTRSGLIQITAFLWREISPREGKGLQLRLSGRSTATAAHSGLQPVPDTVLRLFGRWFYLMLFLCSLSAQHCGRATPSGPWRLTSQQLLLVYCSTSAETHGSFLTLPWLCSQPVYLLILAAPSPSLTNLPQTALALRPSGLAFVRVWGAGLSCHWRPGEPLWFCSCPSGVYRQTALIVGFSHCQDIHHPCRTQQTGKKEGWGRLTVVSQILGQS